mgnify:FL=1
MRTKKIIEEFERILASDKIETLFDMNCGREIPILQGYRITRHESEFGKGRNYGRWEKGDGGIFPTGSLGWFISVSGETRNTRGLYTVRLDTETYELALGPKGLRHAIIHEYRKGSRYATGPDKKYQKRLHQDILHPDFPGYGESPLWNQSAQSWTHDLETTLDAIVFQSSLRENTIIKRLQKIEKQGLRKHIPPKNAQHFLALGIQGDESKRLPYRYMPNYR